MKTRMRQLLIIAFALGTMVITSPAWALELHEIQKLLASEGSRDRSFGYSVAVDGDTVLIGSFGDGAAYVFTRSAVGGWIKQQKLLASDATIGGSFGGSVFLDGDTAVIGAPGYDAPDKTDSGAAYVFTRSAGVWVEQQKLTPSDGTTGDFFGYSVAVDGDTAVIGTGRGANLDDFGAAYVFTRSEGVWIEQQKLTASDGTIGDRDHFGRSVSVDGDTAVIGTDRGASTDNFGAAYVFTRSAGVWVEQQKLTASDGDIEDGFGISVAVDGDTAVIGASGYDAPDKTDSGAAYVFTRSAGVWVEQQKLLASDAKYGRYFGRSVALSGDTAVIGAPGGVDHIFYGNGAAYVFTRSAGRWIEQAKLASSGSLGTSKYSRRFGTSVSVDGDIAVIGTQPDEEAGSAWVFSVERPRLVSLADLNSNGSPEVAVLVRGKSNRVYVRDGSTNALISDVYYGTDQAFDMKVIPDLDGNGNPEIAMLNEQVDGQVRVQIRDSVSGTLARNQFYGANYSATAMRVIDDYNGNGAPEIAVMGSDNSGAIRVQIQDSGTGAFLDNVFLGNKGLGKDFIALGDMSGNSMPELGILSVLRDNDQVRTQVWDAVDSTFQTNVWFGKVYQPQSTMTMPDIDTNGSEEIVAMGVDPATGNIRVQVRDSASAATHYNIWLGNANEAVDLALINDINGNGFAEIAVLLKTSTGTGRVRVQDGLNGAFIQNLFYTEVEDPAGLVVMPDYSGNGFDELAVLGEILDVSEPYNVLKKIYVQILDTATGTQVNRIDFL